MPLIKRGRPASPGASKGDETNGCICRDSSVAELSSAELQPDGTRKWPVHRKTELRRPRNLGGPEWLQYQFDFVDIELAYWKAWIDTQAPNSRAPHLCEEERNND